MIPFIYVHADGACVKEIDRPVDIQVLADSFVNRGGRYLITLFADDVVQLQAVVQGLPGEPHTLAMQTVPNGPLMMGAVDRLVRESVQKLDAVQ